VTIRILHVATRHRLGGAERNLLYSASRELDRGFDVHVAVGTEQLRENFPARVHLHRIPELVREVSPVADYHAVSNLRGIMRAHKFDVVHTHQSKAGALGRAAASGVVPHVVHTVHMASFGPAYGRARSALFLRVERHLAAATHQFIFVGSDLRRRYITAGVATPGRSVVIRSPITELQSLLELRALRHQSREAARVAIGVPAERRVILMVGALDPRKRHALVIEHLAPLLRQRQSQLVIAGDGPERGSLMQLCTCLGIERHVLFLGPVDNVIPLFAAAEVFVHASTLEGVAQAIVQALAAGVPVVATEVDGVREAAPDGPHVFVVPPDGRGLLGTVMGRLIEPGCQPSPRRLLEQWFPSSVDARLSAFHGWLEVQARPRRVRPTPVPQRSVSVPAPIAHEDALR
jgi:glycosyltransferase involved in cell wall biosynthesis